jgi:ADP-ribose pyrophosphatase YjhB (NUDIX family)
MAQSYKVYFAGRPVIFTQEVNAAQSGSVILSRGKMDILMIEAELARGAKTVCVQCQDVHKSWSEFSAQFEFVQAAGGLVTNAEGKILFIYRLEKWDLPKGKMEEGESIQQAAIREVEEECSINQLQLRSELIETWHTYIQQGTPLIKSTRWFHMQYNGRALPQPQLQEGITEVVWLDQTELDLVRKNTYPSVIDVIESFLLLPR